ncbi:glycosyltransferase family 4 protein [bacterium]|nr:glycosyltransferase family 4 protein [bacterium]
MKVLIISHNYIHKIPRSKLHELAKIGNIDLSVIVPKKWKFKPQGYIVSPENNDKSYKLYSLRTIFHNNETKYFYLNLLPYLKKIKPDIIHVEQGAKAFVHFQTLVLKRIFAPKAKVLFFTWANIPYKIKHPFWWFIERFNLKHSDYAICGNEDATRILRIRGFKKPIKVLPLWGTEIYERENVSDLKRKLGLNSFVIGFVGRFVRAKDILLLLKAAAKIKENWQMLLVGKGELKEEIIKLSEELNIKERVIFVDVVPQKEIPKYLNCMDVLVLPSLTTAKWKEQFGHILIEAMACGVPVIGSTSAEIPNVIGDAGLIFKEGDVDDLYRKLVLIMNDKGFREELVKKGKERVLKKYTHKKIAEETYKVYKELLKQK